MLGKRRVAPCNYNESESGSDFDSDSDTDPPRKMATQRRSQVQQCQSKKASRSKPIEDSSSSKELDPSYGHGPPVTSEPVAIIVGEEKEKFFVHAHLLESSSEYFQKVLSAEKEEQALRTVKLLDADANALRIYAKSLYTDRYHLWSGRNTNAPGSTNNLTWDELSVCYTLSHFLQAGDFSDATIDAFTHRMQLHNNAPPDLAKWIYSQTTKDSVHRKLCRDIVVHTWDRKSFDRLWKEDFPREFFEEIFAEVSAQLDSGVKRRDIGQFLASKAACEYHEYKRLKLPCYKVAFGF